jgi:hypothetical protein
VISLCAGDGRDLIGALINHPRAWEVKVRLLELDPQLVAVGRGAAEAAGLAGQIEFVQGDAAKASAYLGMVPADLVLACGVFGNLERTETTRLSGGLSMLCRNGGFLIWTRYLFSRKEEGETIFLRQQLRESNFEEVRFDVTPDGRFGIGTSQYVGQPSPLPEEQLLFRFAGFRHSRGMVGRRLRHQGAR